MRNAQKWKLLAVALASFAIAALASSTTGGIPAVASMHSDGGVAEAPPAAMDAGVMNSQDMDAGMPNELQGSLRGAQHKYAKTTPE
jgi:hypothetical protein